ncbi:MAG TPA: trypsin-like peptidase domain-containing protein, partial [Caulobacteraceae bacterium]|nr:trypsin-like peptidase domain-containing protein [Caulobacteraceae bacterium]
PSAAALGPDMTPFGFQFQIPRQTKPMPMKAQGSGFFISADGYVVTNNHVVENADKITIHTNDGKTYPAHLIGRDQATDLAVVKVDGAHFPYVSFEQQAKARVGDWVVAVGNPFGLGGTATAGIVSALGRENVSGSSYVDYMQIDAPINRGNSGGPTFDAYGRVVGVNTAIFSPSGGSVGIGFDIPADVAEAVSHELIESGKVTRGYIGATIQDITPDIAESLGIPIHEGALVADIKPGGPSEQAGLKSGDLILKVEGHEVTSASDLTRHVALAHPGEDIHLQIRRDGQVRQVAVRSGLRPTEASLNGEDDHAVPDTPAERNAKVLGMELSQAENGVAVQGVSPDSDAGEKGLQSGDVIVRAGDRATRSPHDVAEAAAAAKKAGRKEVLLLIARNGQQIFVPLKVVGEDAKG